MNRPKLRSLKLLRSQSGNVTIMVGLALVLLVVVVGAAVDMARAQILRARISSALDSAAISATIYGNTLAQAQTEAYKYFSLNFPSGYLGSGAIGPGQITVTQDPDGVSLHFVVNTDLKTSFMSMAGINSIPVSVVSDVKRSGGGCAAVTVYVADTSAHIKVYSYNATTNTLSAATEIGSGQVNTPFDVHVDSAGNLWVTDTGNQDIKEFSSSGTLLNTVGTKDNNYNTATPFPPSAKFYPATVGAFGIPDSVTVDASGNLYVTDIAEGYFQVGASSSSVPGSWTWTVEGGYNPPDSLSNPAGDALDANNNLWIADSGNGRYVRYDTITKSIKQIIGPQTEYQGNWGVTVDKFGNVWGTADGSANSVYKFSNSTTGSTSPLKTISGFINPKGITADGCGNIWVTDQDYSNSGANSAIYEFDNNGNQLLKSVIPNTMPAGISTTYSNTASAGAIYIDQ